MSKSNRLSIIIPTYNRKNFLEDTLHTITLQTYPKNLFEVIIVDDGSTDGTSELNFDKYSLNVRYTWQPNQGDAGARNTGSQQSQADILVFIDDDILLHQDYLQAIAGAYSDNSCRIVTGNEVTWLNQSNPQYSIPVRTEKYGCSKMDFADVCSNNMSIRREHYFEVGMMEGLGFPGSSMWCDVDFSYRAFLKGFEFLHCPQAICWHRDYVLRSLNSRKMRSRESAYRAAALFQKYPDLINHVPMFADKTPISWNHDGARLITRKLIRNVASMRLPVLFLEWSAQRLERYSPTSVVYRSFVRWITGAYIFRGYRRGLRDIGSPSTGSS